MQEAQKSLVKMLNDFAADDGFHTTPINGVYCIKNSYPSKREKRHWHSCFGIIAQGCKEVVRATAAHRSLAASIRACSAIPR